MAIFKRRGYLMPVVVLLMALFVFATGAMLTNVSSHIESTAESSSYRRQKEEARLGIKAAEDWLLSSLADGVIPRKDMFGSTPPEKLTAKRPDGKRPEYGGGFDGMSVAVTVFDLNYDSELLGGASFSLPCMPLSVCADGVLRYYLMRSEASAEGRKIKLIDEELIAVSIDNFGILSGASRIFYRTSSSL
ncbi:hypothetical protein FACS1894216_20400 [Synergistales bacterium]|nr:hypothetical protein FACS1894216_20400 [Synergistales bacterium]